MRRLVLWLFLLGTALSGAACESKRSEEPEKSTKDAKDRLQKLKFPKPPPH